MGHDEGLQEYSRIEGTNVPASLQIKRDVGVGLGRAMAVAARIGVDRANSLTQAGDAVTAICDAAWLEGADLVVIRKRRFTFVQRLFGRSVSETLASRCTFAVLSDG